MTTRTDGNQKPANRRRGKSRGFNGQKGGAHTLPWRDDPIIRDRIKAGMSPWMRRASPADCLTTVNEYLKLKYPDEPPISIATLYTDRAHGLELIKDQVHSSVDEHLSEMDEALRVAWRDVEALRPGHARTNLLIAITTAVEKKAKLDGSMRPENQVNVLIVQQVDKLKQLLDGIIHDPRWHITDDQRAEGIEIIADHLMKRAIAETNTIDMPKLEAADD
jgi:hypothetical protein